jgi:hypothetical protein
LILMPPTPVPGRAALATRAATLLVSSGLALAALTGPAGAAERSPGIRWTSEGTGPVTGTVPLRADVSTGKPVDGWVLRGLSPTGEMAFDPVCEDSFAKPRSSFQLDCRWNTTRYPDGRWSANQHYLLRLEVRRADAVEAIGSDRDTTVDNPATAPADVAATVEDGDGERAVITWSANPEPDVDHYDVEERVANGSWRRAGESTTTSFERPLTDPGRYRFRVAAERRRPDGEASRPGRWTTAPETIRTSSRTRSDDEETRPSDRRPDRRAPDSARPGRPERNRPGARDPGDAGTAPAAGPPPAASSDRTDPRSPSSTDRPSRADGDGAARHEGAAPATTTSTRPRDVAPAGGNAPRFPPSSTAGFDALALARPSAPPAGGQAPARHAATDAPEADTGFEQTLPYTAAESDTTPEPEAPEPDLPQIASPAETAGSVRSALGLHRLGGLLLIAAGVGVLTAAVRPRRRRVQPAAGAAHTTAPPAAPSLRDLESRLERLEAHVLAGRTPDAPAGHSQAPSVA